MLSKKEIILRLAEEVLKYENTISCKYCNNKGDTNKEFLVLDLMPNGYSKFKCLKCNDKDIFVKDIMGEVIFKKLNKIKIDY